MRGFHKAPLRVSDLNAFGALKQTGEQRGDISEPRLDLGRGKLEPTHGSGAPAGGLPISRVSQWQGWVHRYDQQVYDLREGVAVVASSNLFGYLDAYGRIIAPIQNDETFDFSGGLGRFLRDGKWGFLGKDGRQILEPAYEWAGDFSEILICLKPSGFS